MERSKLAAIEAKDQSFLNRSWIKRPWPRTTIGAAVAVVVVLIAGAVWMWERPASQSQFLTQKVVVGDLEETVTALGTLQPLQYVDVGTQVSGQLKKIHVTYGDTVEQGQLLAEIDSTVYQARVNADEAQLLNLRAQLVQRQAQKALADLQFQRQKGLLAEDATSRDAYDTAESNQKVANGQLAALAAQIKQAEFTLEGDRANLGYTTIYAPMAGTIVDIIAKQGQTLNANQQAPIVLRIADMASMTVWAEVSEADEPKLSIGMPAYFTTLGNADRRYSGTLRQVLPTPKVVNNVVLYNALFDVTNPDHSLLPQMSAQVFFQTAYAQQVPLVPVVALHRLPAGGGSGAAPAVAQNQGQRGTRPNRTRPADQGATDNAGDQPTTGALARVGRRDGAQRGAQPKESVRYSVRVLEDGKPVTKTIEVGAMSRLVAEVRSGLEPGEEVILDQGAVPGGQQQQRPQQQRGPGGFGGGGPRI